MKDDFKPITRKDFSTTSRSDYSSGRQIISDIVRPSNFNENIQRSDTQKQNDPLPLIVQVEHKNKPKFIKVKSIIASITNWLKNLIPKRLYLPILSMATFVKRSISRAVNFYKLHPSGIKHITAALMIIVALTPIAFNAINGDKIYALSDGPRYASATGDCVNDTGTGTVAWTSPGNAFSDNNTSATVSVDGTVSNYIKCTNFGFSLGSGTVIDGIVVGIERTSNSTGNGGSQDSAVRIVKGGTIGSTDKSTATTYPLNTLTYEDHGGATDLWGETWSYSDINASNFGAAFAATKASAAGAAHTISVDTIRITVYYTLIPQYEQSSYRWFNNQDSSAEQTFAETWGSNGSDLQAVITLDSSNNVYMTGETNGMGAGGWDVIIAKFNSSGVEQWSKTWGGTGADRGYDIAVDSSGNTYVTGTTDSYGAGLDDMFIAKFNSSGVEQWSKTWGTTDDNRGRSIVLDTSGNIFVTGETSVSQFMFITKFDSSGVEQWSKTWGGTGSIGYDLVLDSSGNIYITGKTSSYGAGADDVIISKFNSSGVEQWSKTWGGTDGDTATALKLDGSGNIYITGNTYGYGAGVRDAFIVKFNSSGVEQWSKTWGGTGEDAGLDIVLDASGNIYITGLTYSYSVGFDDMFIAKFNSSGVEQWSKTWGGASYDLGHSIGISSSGYFYVAGESLSYGDWANFITKHDSSGDIASCSDCVTQTITEADQTMTEADQTITEADQTMTEANQTITEADQPTAITKTHCGTIGGYFKTLGGGSSDIAYAQAVDSSGNIYATGVTNSFGTGGDMYITKFNSSGVEQWTKTWGSTNSDVGYAIALDSSTNIYVAGSTGSYGAGSNDAFITKFNSSGVEQWTKTWGSASPEYAAGLALDSSGNIYITGRTSGYGAGLDDMFIAKFNSSGVEQWSKTWGSTSSDVGYGIVLDSSTNIYVTGYTQSYGAGGYDMFIAKFDSSGVEQWSKTWGSTGGEYGYALSLDSSNNIYVTGGTDSYGAGTEDLFIAKFDSSGVEQWSKALGGGSSDTGSSIVLDSSTNIYVTGYTQSYGAGGYDMFIAKFDSSGVEQWSKTLGGTGNDYGNALSLDSSGNLYASGYTASYGSGSDDTVFVKIDKYGASCGGICNNQTITESNQTITESNQTITESNQTITESNQTITETDRSQTESSVNESGTHALIDVGSTLNGVAQNTATTAPAEGTPFRLRLNLHVSNLAVSAGGQSFKLQYAQKSGTCDTSFTGETYADVTTSTLIAFYNNTNATESMPLVANANDPTHSTDSVILQQYQESGNFDVTSNIATGEDGLWDIALVDNGAPASTAYCFRVQTSSGSNITTYTVIPEITTNTATFEQSGYRHFNNLDASATYAQTWGGTSADTAQEMAYDSSGNVFITGEGGSFGAGTGDAYITKFDSSGVEQWTKTWGGTALDYSMSISLDTSGNIFITGITYSYGTGGDMFIAKFDSSGVEQWSKTWGGSFADRGNSLVLDSSGNIFIGGETASYGAGGNEAFITKFNSSGVEQWSKTWGGANNDVANTIKLDNSGNVFITGTTGSYGAGSTDVFIAKFDSSGIEQWSKTWGGTSADSSTSIVLDSSNNIYVTGSTSSYGTGGDMFIAKFDSSGIEQWSKTWGGSNSDDGNALYLDGSNNIFVTGKTSSYGTGGDMFIAKFDSSGIEQWSKTWGGTNFDQGNSVIVESTGYILVSGYTSSYGVSSSDTLITRHDSSGDIANCSDCATQTITEADQAITESNQTITEADQALTETNQTITETDQKTVRTMVHCGTIGSYFNTLGSTNSDVSYGQTVDSSGNTYVTGTTTSYGTGGDMYVSKFNSSGVEQWTKTWGGAGADIGYDIAVDTSSNIFVVGSTTTYGGANGDMFLSKFDSSGVEQWSKTLGGASAEDAQGVVLDSSGNIYVVGSTVTYGAGSADMYVSKFNSSGVEQWTKTWGGASADVAYDLALDSSGNIYATGDTQSYGAGGQDVYIVKFDSSGVEQWSKTWGSTSSESGASLVLDSSGNIYVSGSTLSYGAGNTDMFIAKFNSSGVEQWSKTWGGSSFDDGYSITLDSSGNIYTVGGTQSYGSGSYDMFIAKFDSTGVEQWSKTLGGTGAERGEYINVDSSGNIYTAGRTDTYGAGAEDILVVKIDTGGNSCGGICNDQTITESNQTITESNQTITESNQTITESDQTITEVNRSITEARVNEAPTSSNIGTPLASTNTLATLTSFDTPFRTRVLLHGLSKTATAGSLTFKLQYSAKVGTCDTSFTGESYADVTTSTAMSYYNNSNITDGSGVISSSDDPTHSGHSNVAQTYEESNNFSNLTVTSSGNDYMWDFALSPYSTASGGNYCFRIVYSDNSLLNTYTYIPEISIPPNTNQLMRHGAWFDSNGTKQPFYW